MPTVADILLSIETQIPDVDNAGVPRYAVIPQATLILWLNDACRFIALAAPVIKDWYAVPTVTGQDVYVLPSTVTDVLDGFYDLMPLTSTSEVDNIFINKVSGLSWWLSPHAQTGQGNYWQIWPAANRTSKTTQLFADVNSTQLSLSVVDGTLFQTYGFLKVGDELIRYASLPVATPGTFTNILRGQGGTLAAAHITNDLVTECNLMFHVSRLPTPMTNVDSPVEIPQALWPLIELYVLAKVREMEQDHEDATSKLGQFFRITDSMTQKAQLHKPRQGMQVRTQEGLGITLYNGRTVVP